MARLFYPLFFITACTSSVSRQPPPTSVPVVAESQTTQASDAGSTDAEAPNPLQLVLQTLPPRMTVAECANLCMVQAVCFEQVSGEDYSGGGRCVEDCESYGDEDVAMTETCVHMAEDCKIALKCFD